METEITETKSTFLVDDTNANSPTRTPSPSLSTVAHSVVSGEDKITVSADFQTEVGDSKCNIYCDPQSEECLPQIKLERPEFRYSKHRGDVHGKSSSPLKCGTTASFPQPKLVSTVDLMDAKFCTFQDRSYCSNCYKELVVDDNRPGKKFADILCSRKLRSKTGSKFLGVSVLDALDIIFELNKKSYISEVILDDVEYSMCWRCCSILSKLFKLYVEFTDCTKPPSYIQSIITHNKPLNSQNITLGTNCSEGEEDQFGSLNASYSDSDDPQLNFEVSFKVEDDSYVPPFEEGNDDGPSVRKRARPSGLLRFESIDSEFAKEEVSGKPVSGKRRRGRPRKNGVDKSKISCKKLLTRNSRNKTNETTGNDPLLLHRCEECSAIFSSPSQLERHSSVHSSRKHLCSKCNAGFKFSVYLDRHYATQHSTSENQIERGTSRKIKAGKIKVTTARGKLTGKEIRRAHVCRDCGLVFSTPSSLLRHSHLHENTSYACNTSDCIEEFASKRLLIRHKIEVHKMDPSGVQELQQNPLFSRLKRRLLRDKGDSCDNLSARKKPKKYKCTNCCQSFARSDHIRRHLTVHSESNHICDICDGGFTMKKQLEEHIKAAHVSSLRQVNRKVSSKLRIPRNCPEEGCKYTYTRTNHLRQHLQNMHDGKCLPSNEPQTCPVCNLVVKSKGRLDYHLQKHRPLIRRNYECDVCGKKYRDANNLRNHKASHGLAKPFICEKCGFATKRSYQLTRHIDMVHVGTRSHHCKECGQSFKKKQHLLDHEMTHKTLEYRPYTCTVQGCTKAYRSKRNLRQHLEAHANSKFQCETCGRVFTRKDNLKVHVDTAHLGKPGRAQKEKEKAKAEGGPPPVKKVRKRKQGSDVSVTVEEVLGLGKEDEKPVIEGESVRQTHQVVIVEEANLHQLQQHQQFHLVTDARIIQQGTITGQNIVAIPNPFGEFFYTL